MWVVKDMIGYFGKILCPRFLKQEAVSNVSIPYSKDLYQDNGIRDEICAYHKMLCDIWRMQQTKVYHYIC